MAKCAFLLISVVCLAANRLLAVESKRWWLGNGLWEAGAKNKVGPVWDAQDNVQRRQWFLLDVLLQVHKPLVNAELDDLGSELITDPAMYDEPLDPILMEFLRQCAESEVLSHGDTFSELNPEHGRQLVGLTKFLTLPKDWATFQRNVCYARQNVNPEMFVNALLMAVRDRKDTGALAVPALNEILPQLFYDKDVILAAEAVQWADLVSSYRTMRLRDTLHNQGPLSLIKPSFWRQWYLGIRGLREPSAAAQPEEQIVIPVQEGDGLSYLTDDVGWRIFWNDVNNERLLQVFTAARDEPYLEEGDGVWQPVNREGTSSGEYSSSNLLTPQRDYYERNDDKKMGIDGQDLVSHRPNDNGDAVESSSSPQYQIVDGDRLMARRTNEDVVDWRARVPRNICTRNGSPEQMLMDERSGEIWLQNLQQLVARINLETISLGLRQNTTDRNFVNARPTTTNGWPNLYRLAIKHDVKSSVQESIQQLKSIVDTVLRRARLQPSQPQIVEVIGDILLGGVWDKLYKPIGSVFYGLNRLAQGEPVGGWMLDSVNGLIESYRRRLMPYTTDQLHVPSIQVLDVTVDRLVTYSDVTDSDLINLVDQQLLDTRANHIGRLQKRVVARQRRLNHHPFSITYDIGSERSQRVVVRTFLGPSGEGYLKLEDARPNYVLLNAFSTTLRRGLNRVQSNSRDFRWTRRDPAPLSEIYGRVMRRMLPLPEEVSDCRFPHRLLLPRGTPEGLPLRMLVVVTPVTTEDLLVQHTVNPEHICGLGLATLALDRLPLNFPLDRQIEDDRGFLQPNMLLKDVSIVHEDLV